MLNNFTVVLPGGCNAKCSFCPDSMEGKPPSDWLLKLSEAIVRRPVGWTDCSITGGGANHKSIPRTGPTNHQQQV